MGGKVEVDVAVCPLLTLLSREGNKDGVACVLFALRQLLIYSYTSHYIDHHQCQLFDLDKLWQLLFDDDVEHPGGDGLVEEDALRLAARVPGQQPVERPAADLGEYDWGVAGHAEVLVAAGLADSVGHLKWFDEFDQ